MTAACSLAEASVLILGVGGLGSPAALAMAASGVGRIGLIDDDAVDLSNLARQILHRTEDIGRLKVASGAGCLSTLAPSVKVETHPVRMTAENAAELIGQHDVVIDGSDSLSAKLMLNDACVLEGRPLVTGGILRFFGQLMTIIPGETACYRCVFGRIPFGQEGPSCAEAGVFGRAPDAQGRGPTRSQQGWPGRRVRRSSCQRLLLRDRRSARRRTPQYLHPDVTADTAA